MRLRRILIISALALALVPASASAQQGWFFTPFIGANFGGNADFEDFEDVDDEFEQRVDFGGTLGWNPNVVGFELDFGWSPNFFENTRGDADFDFGDSNVTTLMFNLLVSAPPGRGVRPYGSAGLGLIRSSVSGIDFFEDVTRNDLGLNIGGGLTGYFNDNVGIRGDLRYLRSLEDDDPDDEFDLGLSDFDFWRGSVGIEFRW